MERDDHVLPRGMGVRALGRGAAGGVVVMDGATIIALVRPIAERMAHLPVEVRIALLCGLLTQEVCQYPASERRDELERIIDDLPGILRATEDGMRQALTENARGGL